MDKLIRLISNAKYLRQLPEAEIASETWDIFQTYMSGTRVLGEQKERCSREKERRGKKEDFYAHEERTKYMCAECHVTA